jgi:hypothetical protein|tara:strand:- start:48 stop:212 length:165 start_codon:yes stop_codon:yes gene_type:complete
MDPIKIDMDNSKDVMGSPIQNQEQMITQENVNALIIKDFFESVCLIIFFIFDIL